MTSLVFVLWFVFSIYTKVEGRWSIATEYKPGNKKCRRPGGLYMSFFSNEGLGITVVKPKREDSICYKKFLPGKITCTWK